MASVKEEVENDVFAELEKAKQAKIAAEQAYMDLKKRSETGVTKKISSLIASAGLEPVSLYDGCLSGMPMSGDDALHIAAKLISKAMMPDSQVLSVLKSHRVLTSVSSGEREGAKRSSKRVFYQYMLEDGEYEAIASGKIQEGKHRHDPAFWCINRKDKTVKPEWYSVKGKFGEFARTAEEKKELARYVASIKSSA
ncbi:hypothetical protein HAP94_11885 [Acidithiobacillus ferrivorans]|nr:hypothetical protein [Acidithiobacillus ferrivorans]